MTSKVAYELRDIKDTSDPKHQHANVLTINDGQPEVHIVGSGRDLIGPGGQPPDRYSLVFIILLIHGIGSLMPWNMFINAQDYFRNYKLAQHPGNATTAELDQLDGLRKNFLSYLGLASQIPNVLFNGLNLLVNLGSGNLRVRVNVTLVVEGIIFAITIVLAMLDSHEWPLAFFYMTIVSVIVLNMASGIYQNCIFGTGAIFPGPYINAILIGSNFSGTFTSTIDLLTIWWAPAAEKAAIYYFVTALFMIMICLISYNLLPCIKFYRFFDRASQGQEGHSQPEARSALKVADGVPDVLRKTVDAMVPKPQEAEDTSFKSELLKKWQVFLKCWPQCLNVFLTFYVTLALFPAVLANVQQSQGYISPKYFTSFACFFLFNVFAMIGNLISGWTTWPGKDRVWILTVSRFLFVPVFLFCKFNQKSRKWPVLIDSDIIFIIANILLAASSGYLSSLCMMFASSGLRPEEAPKAGMLAAFFLVLGIFLGVNSSFFLTWIVELG